MSVLLGDRKRFAAEVGDRDHGLRRVDLWAAGKWLTCDDNMAYVAQFRLSVLAAAARLRSGAGSPPPFGALSPRATHRRLMRNADADDETCAEYELRTRFRVLDWGPTTDNVTVHQFRDGDRLTLTFHFWREEHLAGHPQDAGQVFVAEISATELTGILDGLVALLDGDRGDPGPAAVR